MSRSSPRLDLLVVFAALCAAAWGLWRWWSGHEGLPLVERMRDDAFYEFAWAGNLASGRGPMVSDGVHTSGVQLLWSLLLAGVATCLGAVEELPQRAAQLGWACHLAAAVAWLLVLRDRVVGLALALCWAGHPLLLREAGNGQESALASLMTVLLLTTWRAPPWCFCSVAVLTPLARLDLLALVFGICWLRHRSGRRGAVAAAVAASSLPLLVNLGLAGGLLPDSGAPMAWLWHAHQADVDGSLGGFLRRQWWYMRPVFLGGPFATASVFGWGVVTFVVARPWWPRSLRALPALAVGVASALGVRDLATPGFAALLLVLFPRTRGRRLPRLPLVVLLGLGAVVALHWAVRWYPRDYYLCPLVAGAFAVVARYGRWRLLLLVLAIVQLQDSWRIRREPLRDQQARELAGRMLADVVPPGERVGCFNSGIVTWFADVAASPERRRAIVNLDGVVDARSYAALRERRLDEFLDREGVRFVLDSSLQFARSSPSPHASGRFFGEGFDPDRDLVEVARFVVPFAGDDDAHGAAATAVDEAARRGIVLYWRRGRGEAPPRPVWLSSSGEVERAPGVRVVPVDAGSQRTFERRSGGSWTLQFAAPTWLFLGDAPEPPG